MAKVAQPMFGTDASGSVGGIQFRSLRAGTVVNPKQATSRKSTAPRTSARAALSRAVRLWPNLTPATQARWRAAAESPALGFNLWVKRCVPLLRAGADPPYETSTLLPYAMLDIARLEAPGPPEWIVVYQLSGPPTSAYLAQFFDVFTAAHQPRPDFAKFTLRYTDFSSPSLLGWQPYRHWERVYYEVRIFAIDSGQLVQTLVGTDTS